MKALTVYYVPTCADSAAVVSYLFLRGADARLVNLEQHPDSTDAVKRAADGQVRTPMLEVEGEWHAEPTLPELKQLLERWGLPTEAAPHEQKAPL